MNRCTGHCCKAFTLPISPDELKAKAGVYRDGHIIADMAVYLGTGTHDLKTGEFVKQENSGWHVYGCRHLQGNGDCGIYENRPFMCRDYPYGHPCKFENCTAENGGCA